MFPLLGLYGSNGLLPVRNVIPELDGKYIIVYDISFRNICH